MKNLRLLLLAATFLVTSCGDSGETDNTNSTNDSTDQTGDTGGDTGGGDTSNSGPSYSCDGVDIILDDTQDDIPQVIEWAFVGNPDEQILTDTDPNLYPPKVLSIKTLCNDTDREVTISFSEELTYSDSSNGDCGSCEMSEPDSVTDFYYGFVYDTFDTDEALSEAYPAYIGSAQLELSLSPGEGGTLITRLKQYSEGCNSVCDRPYPLDETVTTSITVSAN